MGQPFPRAPSAKPLSASRFSGAATSNHQLLRELTRRPLELVIRAFVDGASPPHGNRLSRRFASTRTGQTRKPPRSSSACPQVDGGAGQPSGEAEGTITTGTLECSLNSRLVLPKSVPECFPRTPRPDNDQVHGMRRVDHSKEARARVASRWQATRPPVRLVPP